MIRSRVFIVLAISLFFAGFPSVEGTGGTAEVADKKTAEEKVNALKELTKEVLGTAETKFNDAESTKSDLESQKNKAERAEADAKIAAGKITAVNRNAEADAVAKEAEKELGEFRKLYDAAKAKVDQAFNDMNGFVTRAKELDNNAKNKLLPASVEKEDYTNVIQNAANATSDTQRLKQEIDASNVLSDKDPALVKLRDSAKNVQVLKYKAESIAIVYNIETALKTAETDIQSIQQNKDKIDTIVQAMNTKRESASNSLKSSLTPLCTTAENQLQTATSKVKEAQKCNDDMKGNKKQVDKDLETLMATTEEVKATEEAGKIKRHEEFIDSELQKIKQALRATDTAFSSAESAQQQMQNEMDKKKSQSGTEYNKGRQTDNVRTAGVTNPIRSGEAKNPAITKKVQQPAMKSKELAVIKTENPSVTKTDKTALKNSKDTMDKTPEQPVDAHLDNTKENKSVKLTDKETQNPKDGNSESLNNDTLHKSTKNITNNPLIGGEVATRSAANDSAVTVFIPLLVIVVISAVLH